MAKSIFSLLARLRQPKRREEAACYSYDDSLFLCAICEVRDGPGVQWEPFRRLSSDEADDALGHALAQILERSGRVLDIKNPSDLRDARSKQLRAAGFSSERNLQRRAVFCHVERLVDSVRVTPTHNGGNRGDEKGFHDLEEAAISIPCPATSSELGAALRAALRKCTGQIDAPAA